MERNHRQGKVSTKKINTENLISALMSKDFNPIGDGYKALESHLKMVLHSSKRAKK